MVEGDGGQRLLREGLIKFDDLKSLWLFDVESDPEEKFDLSAAMPDKVAELDALLAHYESQAVPPHRISSKEDVLASASKFLENGQPVVDIWSPSDPPVWDAAEKAAWEGRGRPMVPDSFQRPAKKPARQGVAKL